MQDTASSEPMVIDFDAAALAPAAYFAAKRDVRYYLNGICVMPHPTAPGCIVVGCDGHRLAMWYDENGKCSRRVVLTVSKELIAASRKRNKLIPGDRRVQLESGRLVLKAWYYELYIQAGQAEVTDGGGNYPNVWRVVPPQESMVPGLHGSMNTEYLADLGCVGRLLSMPAQRNHGSTWGALDHYSNGSDGNGSVLTRFFSAPNFIVITMPMRADEYPRKQPVPAIFANSKAAA